jgi:hypothetical protein
MKNVNIKIIKEHHDILNIIKEPIPCLVNFDWHADYPRYAEEIIDVDYFVLQLDYAWYEDNWVAVLATHGYVREFTWIFPHDDDKEDTKVFGSQSGDSIIFNKKFNKDMEIFCEYVTIDLDFFGSRTPVNWSPKDRVELLRDTLITLKADNVTLIICKSERFVNYDVDKFLQGMLIELLCGQDKGEIYWKKCECST